MEMDALIGAARELRAHLQEDSHRPRFHFTSPEGRCYPFDPNGAIFWKGRYHLFYIVQEEGLGHCWGHASSLDLLHWRLHPNALIPGDGDKGIFSGCALVDREGVPTIAYLGIEAGLCVARSLDDELIEWQKISQNPVLPIPAEGKPGYGTYAVHDPHVWLEGDTYYAILNSRRGVLPEERYDIAYLFRSADLVSWEYLHPFYEPNPDWTDPEEDCAVPDFFPLGDRHMLLCCSHHAGARYYLGRYENERFCPDRHVRMNWPGGTFFAPESLVDESGRRIFWAWVCEAQSVAAQEAAGWSGVLSLPRVLSPGPDGTVLIDPIEELDKLRLDPVELADLELVPGGEVSLDGVKGISCELRLEIDLGSADQVGIRVRCSPDRDEETTIILDRSADSLSIDATRSSLSPEVFAPWPDPFRDEGEREPLGVQTAPLQLSSGEMLVLRIFIDGSILEVFANRRQCITQRIYPTRDDSVGVGLFSRGGAARVRSLSAWEMAAANAW